MRSLLIGIFAACLSLFGIQTKAGPFAYISNTGDNTVSVIDTATNTVVAIVSVGSGPVGVAANSSGSRVFVVNQGGRSLSSIDTATNSASTTVSILGLNPHGIAVNSSSSRAYIGNTASNNVSVLDTNTNLVVAFVAVGSFPVGLAVNPTETRVYVANQGSNSVSVIDAGTNAIVATVPVGDGPFGLAINSTGSRVYVANRGVDDGTSTDTVSVIDTATNSVIASIQVGIEPLEVAIGPMGTRIYVSNSRSNNITVIDTASNTVLATVPVGNYPSGLAVNPSGTRVFVVNQASNNMSVVDTASNTVVATVSVGSSPSNIALSSGEPAIGSEPSIIRVSVDSAGVQGNSGYFDGAPSISADGRYVAFGSSASNLVADDSNGAGDVFVRDTVSGTTTRVSVDSAGVQGNKQSLYLAISADGRYVAFQSDASNLVTGDSNGSSDVFIRDTVGGTTTRVSVDSAGAQGNLYSNRLAISADGRYVAFESDASNLVTGDSNGFRDVFIRDTVSETTTRVSVGSAGVQGNVQSFFPSISADGRYVAFESSATNLVASDSNGFDDIFVRDTVSGTTTRASVDSAGVQANLNSFGPSISSDGRYVTFGSAATNLVAGDSNGTSDVFVRDTVSGTTTRVNVDSAGVQGNNQSPSFYTPISADGRYVAFYSDASNLVTGDSNGTEDIFVRDTVRGTTTRVSVDNVGVQGNLYSIYPSISADGRYVAFYSGASNLTPGDNNGVVDVFRVRIASEPEARVPATPTGLSPGTYTPPGPELSSSNVLLSWNLIPGATYYDLGVRDVASGVLVVNSTSATSTFSPPSLTPGRAYKWNVAACNSLGCSKFAQALFFQTPVAPTSGPAAPEQISPGYRSSAESKYGSQVTLTWSPVLGAGAYSVGLFDVTAGTLVPIPLVIGGTTSKLITMETGHAYRWDVASCINDSVNDDVNCPNRSDDLLFVQGDGTGYGPVLGPIHKPGIVQDAPAVDSLVLVVHGWNSYAAVWPNDLVERICGTLGNEYGLTPVGVIDHPAGGKQCTVGRWHVISYDWNERAFPSGCLNAPLILWPLYCSPDAAVANAKSIGTELGTTINPLQFNFLHLIAHSAGSELIQSFAETYNSRRSTPADIHMTFLDAYCKNVSQCRFGKGATWAEQYVDHRFLSALWVISETDWGLNKPPEPYNYKTNVNLKSATTFDVTNLDRTPDYPGILDEINYHAFPYLQYLDSAGKDFKDTGIVYSAAGIEYLEPQLGAYLAAWADENVETLSFNPAAHTRKLAQKFGDGGNRHMLHQFWILPLAQAPAVEPVSPTNVITGSTLAFVSSTCGGGSTSSTISVGNCSTAARAYGISALSVAPDLGTVAVSVALDNVADRLSFDYQFTSAANAGYLQVFLDNSLAFIVASDGDAGSLQQAGPIEITRLEPGAHELRVVVKSDTAESASVVISNIVFDRVVSNVPDAPLMNTATAGNHQATVVFSEAAYNGGAPVTGFTVTSSPAGGIDSQAGTLGEGHLITGLNNGTDYTFTVTATNAAGISAPSLPSNSVRPLAVDGLSVGNVSLAEGNSGTQLATFTISLSAASAGAVSFDISTDNGTAASGSDFVAKSQAGLTIAAGQTSASFAVTLSGDSEVEGNETFTVNLTNAVGADIVDGQGAGTITNDDNAALSIADVALVEGNSGISTATFIVTLSNPMPTPVTFDIATSNGSAASGSDYVARNQPARVLDAGRTRSLFEVTINGDAAVEGNETFSVTVSNVVGATLGDGAAIGTIQNDDAAAVKNDEGAVDENGTLETKSIAQIQGRGVISPWQGKSVSTEGIVTALTGDGLFMQTADAYRDGNPTTAEGIFVATADGSIKMGDAVRVHGMVREAQIGDDPNQLTLTQIVATRVLLLSSGNALPQAVQLDASNAGAHQSITGLERYEGMRVSVPVLNVIAPAGGNINETTGQAQSNGRFYGVAAGVARPFREPGISALDLASGRRGASPPVFDTNPERLLIDSLGQRGAPALPADAGDTVTGLVGVLGYGDGAYQVLPDPTASVIITLGASPKPASVPTAAQATIGSLNLRRFLDDRQASSEPVLTPAAYALRVAKTANVICAYARTPDILGVAEVENRTTLSDLAAAVNGNDGNVLFPANCQGDAGYRAYLLPGNDARQRNLGFLVSTAPVRPGVPRVEVLSVTQAGNDVRFRQRDGSYEPLNERPPLILQARINEATGRSSDVTVVANHLSALDGNLAAPGARGWTTRGDYLRARRAAQALSLAQLIQARQRANPQEKLVVLGDFGASEFNQGHDDLMGVLAGREAPRTKVLRHVGSPITPPLTNLTSLVPELERYTDIRDGSAQALSHVLVNKALLTDYPDLHLETVRINADFAMDHFGDSTVPMRAADSDPQVLYLERH